MTRKYNKATKSAFQICFIWIDETLSSVDEIERIISGRTVAADNQNIFSILWSQFRNANRHLI